MTEITYAVTIIASVLFVLFIIYPLLKGVKRAPESVHFSITLVTTRHQNLKRFLKKAFNFLKIKIKNMKKQLVD